MKEFQRFVFNVAVWDTSKTFAYTISNLQSEKETWQLSLSQVDNKRLAKWKQLSHNLIMGLGWLLLGERILIGLVEIVGLIIQTKVILLFPRASQTFWNLLVRVMKESSLGYLSLEKWRTQQRVICVFCQQITLKRKYVQLM